MIEAISEILGESATRLRKTISCIKCDEINNTQLVLELSQLYSVLRTLETMTAPFKVPEAAIKASEPYPPMKFLNDVADDNPEQEDIEAKKQREENSNFYG